MPNENRSTDLFEIIRTTRSMRLLKPRSTSVGAGGVRLIFDDDDAACFLICDQIDTLRSLRGRIKIFVPTGGERWQFVGYRPP